MAVRVAEADFTAGHRRTKRVGATRIVDQQNRGVRHFAEFSFLAGQSLDSETVGEHGFSVAGRSSDWVFVWHRRPSVFRDVIPGAGGVLMPSTQEKGRTV